MADALTKLDGSAVSDEELESAASALTDSFTKPKTGTTYALSKAAENNAAPSWDDSEDVSVNLEGEPPKNFTKSLSDLQSQSKNLSRMDEKGFVNEQTGAAMAIRKDGQINLSASRYAQYRMNPNGKIIEQTMEKHDVTNRLSITTDEILVNNHKLNPAFYELTDMKLMKLPTTRTGREPTIGNLTVECSILVKAWDKHLKRYMLVRRPARLPLFSNLLNVPDITPGIHVHDPLKVENASQFMALSTGGYQVNAAITDAKSLIGKEGITRYGAESGGGASMGQFQAMQGTSGQVEKAIQWAISIANDDSHLYSQEARTGPHYDCSSFVYHAFEHAGFGVISNRGYAGNCDTMPEDFKAAGFQMLPFDQNNLQRGDILWKDTHTEIYLGDGKKVGAHGRNNRAEADQISVNDMYYDWTHIFRCVAPSSSLTAGAVAGQAETFNASAYYPDGSAMEGGFGTAYGVSLQGKTVNSHYMAVNPNTIPYGTVCILSFPSPYENLNGEWVAVDTGGYFTSHPKSVDLMFGSGLVQANREAANTFGRRDISLAMTNKKLTVEEAEHWKE